MERSVEVFAIILIGVVGRVCAPALGRLHHRLSQRTFNQSVRPARVRRYGRIAGAGTIVAGNGQLPLSYGGQFGTASSGGG